MITNQIPRVAFEENAPKLVCGTCSIEILQGELYFATYGSFELFNESSGETHVRHISSISVHCFCCVMKRYYSC